MVEARRFLFSKWIFTKVQLKSVLSRFINAGLLLLSHHHVCYELSTSSALSNETIENDSVSNVLNAFELQNSSSHAQTESSATANSTDDALHLYEVTSEPSNRTLHENFTIESVCQTESINTKDARDLNYSIKSIAGDIMVTIILRQSDNGADIIEFIVNHINEIDFLVHNVTIGEFLSNL
jgi:hypothetical protein